MSAPADHYVEVNGVRLHYLDWGNPNAPTLLMLHGGSAHAHWWDLFAAAAAADYHCVALDLRGHGDSDHVEPPAYTLEDYVADVAAVVDHLGCAHLAIMGHSLGAMVAITYAGQAAVPIDAVVIVDIRIRVTHDSRRFLERLRYFPHPVYPSRADAVRRFRLLPSATTASPATLAHVAGHGLRDLPDGTCTPKFDRAALGGATPRDMGAALARLTSPVLYVRGEKSIFAPHKTVDEVRESAPHAATAEIPGAHHHLMLDNPADFERVVRRFLAGVIPSGSGQAAAS